MKRADQPNTENADPRTVLPLGASGNESLQTAAAVHPYPIPQPDLNVVDIWDDHQGRAVVAGILNAAVDHTHPGLAACPVGAENLNRKY